MKIGIGIDTGGTYTDAAIYDFDSGTILGTAKALTTKDDLSIGILEALDALPEEPLKSAEIISLSTTLATNACVEDRGGRAKLIFFGGDRIVIDKYGSEYGLPPANEMYIQDSYTKFSGEIEREPDWDLFNSGIDTGFSGLDGAGIIEMFAMKNSAVVEKKAKELFLLKHNIPVVCGHELFSELNCLQRGSSTLLNARLIPVIKEFLDAIERAMKIRGIKASVVIVRSDGSLMSGEFAHIRPVETLLCGPAASVMGISCLTDEKNSVVVDMGGTTTDIAVINNGSPHKVTEGVNIGKWKTFVNGLYIKTLGLGGDTAVHYNESKVFLEDYRVVPLCAAAAKYPQIINNLKKLKETKKKHTKNLHEHYMLVRDIAGDPRYNSEEKVFCDALGKGPLPLAEAAVSIPGKDIYSFDVSRLIKEGVVQVCGLTPTDIMHIKGDFVQFSAEASLLGAQYTASNMNITTGELCDSIYDEIRRKLYVNIVKVMLEIQDSHYMKNGVNKDAERFINDCYEMAKAGRSHTFISTAFSTGFTLAGVGAPIHIFLDDVGRMLGTKAVIPKHYEVANALGAVIGNVLASCAVEIRPNYTPVGISGYTVFGSRETRVFQRLEDAEIFAVVEAREGAYTEAVSRGARDEIATTCRIERNDSKSRDGLLYLGSQAVAQAAGSPGF